MLQIFAPTSTDDEYFRKLINGITPKNAEDQLAQISQLLTTSTTLSRKEVVPILDKVKLLIEANNIESSTNILYTFNRQDKIFFKSNELSSLFSFVISNQELHKTSILPPLFSISNKSVTTYEDLITLIPNPIDLAEFVPYASNQFVMSLIVKAAQLDPNIRVPLVFNGLIEQILPTINTNETHLSLLSLLITESKARKYFIDMGHVPRLLDALFHTNISATAANCLCTLLSKNDLTNLFNAQKIVYEDGTFNRLLDVIATPTIDDETVINALKCLENCIFCHKLSSFDSKMILDLCARRPKVRGEALNLVEILAMSNPSLLFTDKDVIDIEELRNDKYFLLFLSFICYECHRSSILDLTKIEPTTMDEKVLLCILSIQRRKFYEAAAFQANDPNEPLIQCLAAVLCIITKRCGDKKSNYIQLAIDLFEKPPENAHFPKLFIYWGLTQFSKSKIGYWMKDTQTNVEMKTDSIFSRSPTEAADEVSFLNTTANNVILQSRRLRTHCQALEEEKKEAEEEYIEIEKELIDARCTQLTNHITVK